MSSEQPQKKTDSNESLKLAIAMALFRSKLHQRPPPSDLPSQSDAHKWKRKSKERKQQILRLKEDLKEAEEGLQHDLFPQSASCKCYLFENLGKLSPNRFGGGFDQRFSDVLHRRFLRQVRLKERRRKNDCSKRRLVLSDYNTEEETEQLRASVDFLVELCDTVSSLEDTNFANWSHQAVDFILAAIKNLSSVEKDIEPVDGIVNSLVMRLMRRLCTSTTLQGDEVHQFDIEAQFYVQHLLRKLGSEACIGQRVILAVSQRISVLAENMLFIDPFDETFPGMHSCMYIMIQLIEFLVSDYLLPWSNNEGFDTSLLEQWVTSILHARKGLELFESRNGLYVLYMDRLTGEVAKQVGQIASLQKLNPDILENLFR